MYHDSPLAADDWQSRLSCHAALATLAAKLNNYTGTKVLATYKLKAFAILPVKFAGSLGLGSGLAHLGLVCGEPTAGRMSRNDISVQSAEPESASSWCTANLQPSKPGNGLEHSVLNTSRHPGVPLHLRFGNTTGWVVGQGIQVSLTRFLTWSIGQWAWNAKPK